MAKTTGPLMSISAHGTMGGALTYSARKNVNQCRFQKKQHYTATTAQSTQRSYFQKATGWWSEMTTAEKSQFNGYEERAI
jgi:hypothetical protein